MQTISKFDPPRNRSSYGHDRPDYPSFWKCLNRAEYHIWCATKIHESDSRYWKVSDIVERKSERARHLSAARDYLRIAKSLKTAAK